jgi:hypothetical protein
MQAVSSWPETMRMGSCGFNSLDQAACAVEIDLSGHAVGRSSAHTHTQGHGSLVRMHRVCQSLLAVDPSSLRAGCWSWSLNSTGRPAVRNSPRSPRGIVNPAERAGSTHLCCPLSSVIVFIVGHFVLGRVILGSRIVDGWLMSDQTNKAIANTRYMRHAREKIPCHCKLCRCPANAADYTFTYVCEKRRFIYYDIPKCASSTIRHKLFGDPYPLPHEESLVEPEKPLSEYFKFAIIRNPWSRMVSNWRMFTTQAFRINQLAAMTNRELSSFPDFCEFAVNHPNHHWQPQVDFLPDPLDYLGRMESMDESLRAIGAKITGFDTQNLVINGTHVCDDPWRYQSYYDQYTHDLVAKFYHQDIECFGYVF